MDALLKLILEVEKKPALYIGNKDLRRLDHFLSGYRFAKREEESSFGDWFEHDFREYLSKKYNDKRTFNVAGLIRANEEDGNSTDAFFRLLHEFLEKHVV